MLDKLIGAALQGLGSGSGGVAGSPIMNVILQLLMSGMAGGQTTQGGGLLGQVLGGAGGDRGSGDPLGGLLGGLLGGGQASRGGGSPLEALAGAILGGQGGGGLDTLLSQLQRSGLGAQADSWVSQGANLPISPDQLLQAFGQERLQGLAQRNGLDLGDMLSGLSQQLPDVVNEMTPSGRMPETMELSELLGQVLGRGRSA